MSYGDYLDLERVLDAQEPLSKAHDELLFIIQHQTSELWMKLAIHEMSSAMAAIREDRLQPAFKMLSRVARIFEQLTGAWDVLRTMTPSEYTHFRDRSGSLPGFNPGSTVPSSFWPATATSPCCGRMRTVRRLPQGWRPSSLRPASTRRRCISWRATASTSAPTRSAPTGARPASKTLMCWPPGRPSTGDPEKHWALYDLAEKLVDFEDYFRRWRFNHVTTVERIIGLKRGTGGTAGVSYLRRMLEVELFPELWKVRTAL